MSTQNEQNEKLDKDELRVQASLVEEIDKILNYQGLIEEIKTYNILPTQSN